MADPISLATRTYRSLNGRFLFGMTPNVQASKIRVLAYD